MKKKYNKKFFKSFQKANKIIRNKCSADPLEKIKETSLTGKIIGKGCDKLIAIPIHQASYGLSGLTYDERYDNPCKGAATYTGWHLTLSKACNKIIGFLLTLPIWSILLSYMDRDLLISIRILLGLLPLIWIGYKINGIIKWIKKVLK